MKLTMLAALAAALMTIVAACGPGETVVDQPIDDNTSPDPTPTNPTNPNPTNPTFDPAMCHALADKIAGEWIPMGSASGDGAATFQINAMENTCAVGISGNFQVEGEAAFTGMQLPLTRVDEYKDAQGNVFATRTRTIDVVDGYLQFVVDDTRENASYTETFRRP